MFIHHLWAQAMMVLLAPMLIASTALATAIEESATLTPEASAEAYQLMQQAADNSPPVPREGTLISEASAGIMAAASASDGHRRQVHRVAQYIGHYNKQLPSPEVMGHAQSIVHFSQRYGVDYRLLTSVIAVESAFRRDAISSSGAIGMGQLKPDTAKWLGVVDPYDPVDNIAGTARFLSWLIRKYNGSLEHALSAYYQGPGTVDRNGITPACIPYLEKVNRALAGLL